MPVIISAKTPPNPMEQTTSIRPQIAVIIYKPVVTSFRRRIASPTATFSFLRMLARSLHDARSAGDKITLKVRLHLQCGKREAGGGWILAFDRRDAWQRGVGWGGWRPA